MGCLKLTYNPEKPTLKVAHSIFNNVKKSSAERYMFGYQGSEKDNEVNSSNGTSYTTEFRQLDTRLGRWFSSDPVFQPWQSSYTSMDNNPINLTDVRGLSGEIPNKVKHKGKDHRATKLSPAQTKKIDHTSRIEERGAKYNVYNSKDKDDKNIYVSKDGKNFYLLEEIETPKETKKEQSESITPEISVEKETDEQRNDRLLPDDSFKSGDEIPVKGGKLKFDNVDAYDDPGGTTPGVGLQISLQLNNNQKLDDNSKYKILQTYVSNDNINSNYEYTKVEPGQFIQSVDFSNLNGTNSFIDFTDGTMGFYDIVARTGGNNGNTYKVYWQAETSILQITNSGNIERLVTFTWGFTTTPDGQQSFTGTKIVNSPSAYHLKAIKEKLPDGHYELIGNPFENKR